MTPSKALFCFCISFVVGIALDSMIKIPQIFIWGFLILGIGIIFSYLGTSLISQNRRPSILRDYKNNLLIVGFCVLFLVLGILRFQISTFNIENSPLKIFNDTPGKIMLVGFVSGEPDVRDTLQKLKITTDKGDVLVTLSNRVQYHYLDTIQITGTLETPVVFDNFNYKNYLMKDGIYSVMDFPSVTLISREHSYTPFSFLYEKILFLKGKLMNSIDMNFFPPDSDILKGVVFGNDKNMSKDIKNKFNVTGLSHLTAVSGSNIVILISALMIFLLALGFWRGQAFYFAVALIWAYIILIGFPVSGVRAVIMGSIALLAQKLGRQNTSSRVLVIAASFMLLQNPLLLLYDIGFQLSFLASWGIIYCKPLLEHFIKMVTKEHLSYVVDMTAVTLAAQICVVPILVYNFGSVSLVAPLTNMLVSPIVAVLTVAGFLTSVLGIFSNFLGWFFSLPCWLLLFYFTKILDIFSKPWAVTTISNVSLIWLIVYYMALVLLIWYLRRYLKSPYLR